MRLQVTAAPHPLDTYYYQRYHMVVRNEALLRRIRNRRQNVRFRDFVRLIEAMGFNEERQVGSHRLFVHECGAVLNLQEEGGEAKPYQIKQFLNAVDSYGLRL